MLYVILLILLVFGIYFLKKKITKQWFEDFLMQFMEKRVSQYKMKNLENHAADETDMVEFLENQKQKFLNKEIGLLNIIVFTFFKKLSGFSNEDCQKIVGEFYEKEIKKVIVQDLRFKDFQKICENIHFQLTDWEFILEKPKVLYQASRKNIIKREFIEKLIIDVEYSKTDFSDEFTTKSLNRIQYNVINLLIELKNIKQEI